MSSVKNSPLERACLSWPAIVPEAEPEIDLLRDILRGYRGTMAERATLIRIIKNNKIAKPLHLTLAKNILPSSEYTEMARNSKSHSTYITPPKPAKPRPKKRPKLLFDPMTRVITGARPGRRLTAVEIATAAALRTQTLRMF